MKMIHAKRFLGGWWSKPIFAFTMFAKTAPTAFLSALLIERFFIASKISSANKSHRYMKIVESKTSHFKAMSHQRRGTLWRSEQLFNATFRVTWTYVIEYHSISRIRGPLWRLFRMSLHYITPRINCGWMMPSRRNENLSWLTSGSWTDRVLFVNPCQLCKPQTTIIQPHLDKTPKFWINLSCNCVLTKFVIHSIWKRMPDELSLTIGMQWQRNGKESLLNFMFSVRQAKRRPLWT